MTTDSNGNIVPHPKAIDGIDFVVEEIDVGHILIDLKTDIARNATDEEVMMWNTIKTLHNLNKHYRLCQDSTSFIWMDACPDRPWTEEEFEIVNRHNEQIKKIKQETIEMAKEKLQGVEQVETNIGMEAPVAESEKKPWVGDGVKHKPANFDDV